MGAIATVESQPRRTQAERPLGRVDQLSFRGALRALPTGVTVLTSAGPQSLCAVTASAVTSLSLEPPLMLACLRADSAAAAAIAGNGAFAINVLGADQQMLARRFAAPARPRGAATFDGVAHELGITGAVLLHGAVAWLECRLQQLHDGGDHVILIGELLGCDGDPSREPLVFHAGGYRALGDRSPRTASGPCLQTGTAERG